MKKYLLLVFLGILTKAFGQDAGGSVGIGSAQPDVSARLDVSSINKGVLIPRVQLTGIDDAATIPTPATGLLVFNIGKTLPLGIYVNMGTTIQPVWSLLQMNNNTLGSNVYKLRYLGSTDDTKRLSVDEILEFKMSYSGYVNTWIRLLKRPTSDIFIKVARVGFRDSFVTGVNYFLTFTPSNWNTWQMIDYQDVIAGHMLFIQSSSFDKFWRLSTFSDNVNFNSMIVESF